MKRLAVLLAVAALALPASGVAHDKPTCSHVTVYSGWVTGFGYTWKAVHYGIGGFLDQTHSHSHKHYYRTPSNPTWVYKHLRATDPCAAH